MLVTLATSNPHKVEEINTIAKNFDIEFVLPDDNFDPVENGDNFIDNAVCKVLEASKSGKTELYLADDSGLCVEELNNEPGIYSARYAPTPNERIEKLLKNMRGIENRSAKFVCAMVVANKKGEIIYKVQSECKGRIMYERKGSNGFGYDPIFFVEELNKGMAELSQDEKCTVSHRGKALRQVLEWLRNEFC